MKYYELAAIQQKRIDDVPLHFAFGDADFKAELDKLGVTVDDVVGIGGGGFMLKSEAHLLAEATKINMEEEKAFFEDDANMLDAMEYELANHEYCITYDADDALCALGLSRKDERVQRLLPEAVKLYMLGVEACN